MALLVARARVELRFDSWFSRRATVDAGSGAEIQLWTLGLRGCWAPRVAIVEFPSCGGVQAGPMRGDGFGIGAPTSTRLAWVAFEGGAALVVLPWRFLGFRVGADLLVPATRPGFAIDDRASCTAPHPWRGTPRSGSKAVSAVDSIIDVDR